MDCYLNIDGNLNTFDFELAKRVGDYFQLSNREMNKITDEVTSVVKQLQKTAHEIGISRQEQELMHGRSGINEYGKYCIRYF